MRTIMENIRYVRLLYFIIWIQNILCQCPDTVYPGIKGFGQNCKYRCNCKDNVQCNEETGECPDGCLFGWMGPGCQYRNLATASNDSKQNNKVKDEADWALKAIDGNVKTCSKTGNYGEPKQQSWHVVLSTEFYIVGLVIKIRNSDKAKFRGFSVEIGNTSNNYEVCYQHAAGIDGEIVMNVNCVRPIIGNTVEIKLEENMPPPLVLCEVELFGGRLVSFNRLTEIESALNYMGKWIASYAVDGRPMLSSNENQNTESQRTCSATMDYSPSVVKWWNVHLDSFYDIQGISFFGRLDMKTSQYSSYKILVGNDSSQTELIFTDTGSEDIFEYNPKSKNFSRPYFGSAVRVERSAKILVVCEFEVFAECPLGRCGWECSETCMCISQTTEEHKIQGTCPYGCSGRWNGQNGKCNIECSVSKWGPYCNQTCGHCKNNDLCSSSNGNCPDSCKPGFIPPFCLHGCYDGYFGEDCNLTCGHCQDDSVCNKVTGICVSGCKPGYKLPLCNQTCDLGWYGVNCSSQCGRCKDGEACNNRSGECTGGCSPGWQTSMCNRFCEHGWFGIDCSSKCGSCKHGETCNNTNGECARGCSPGWLTSKCNLPCDSGLYGDGCDETCGFCMSPNEVCNHEDGSCLNDCTFGYHGPICKTVCVSGWYGVNCSSQCGRCKDGEACNNTNGECSSGCSPGWLTSMCNKFDTKEPQEPSFTVGIIIGFVAAVVGTGLAFVSAIIIWKRKTIRNADQNVSSNPSPRTGIKDENVYNELDTNRMEGNQEMWYSELKMYANVAD